VYIVEAQVKRASEEAEPVGLRRGMGVEKQRGLEKVGWRLLRVWMA
jgi:uncharacterized protein YunC (DUF1805 family)